MKRQKHAKTSNTKLKNKEMVNKVKPLHKSSELAKRLNKPRQLTKLNAVRGIQAGGSRPKVPKSHGTPVSTQTLANRPTVLEKFIRKRRIVRIMGHGQFAVDNKTLKKLNELDHSIVELVGIERSDDNEFRKRLSELNRIVMKDGKPLDPKEIIQSDIILPSPDLSIDEAKKLFRGEGVVPEL